MDNYADCEKQVALFRRGRMLAKLHTQGPELCGIMFNVDRT